MSSHIPIGETLLRIQEQVLDEELSKYDAIPQGAAAAAAVAKDDNDDYDDDESVLQRLRLMRLQQLQKEQSQKKQWQAAGHGTYTEIVNTQNGVDVAQEFFRITKQSEQVVVLFYRENQNHSENYCDIYHKHLETLARTHWETKFCKLDVGCNEDRKGATFLVEQFQIRIIPTVLLIRNRKVVHTLRGFDEIHREIQCSAGDVAATLAQYKVLKLTEQEIDKIETTTTQKQHHHSSTRFLRHQNKNSSFDSHDDDKEDF